MKIAPSSPAEKTYLPSGLVFSLVTLPP